MRAARSRSPPWLPAILAVLLLGLPTAVLVAVPAEAHGVCSNPTAPGNMTAVRTGRRGEAKLNWSPATPTGVGGCLLSYNVYRRVWGEVTNQRIASTWSTNYTDTDLPDATRLVYSVRAVSGEEGPNSNDATVWTPGLPTAPRNVTASPGPGRGEVTLSWAPPSDPGGTPAGAYRVYRHPAAPAPFATTVHSFNASAEGFTQRHPQPHSEAAWNPSAGAATLTLRHGDPGSEAFARAAPFVLTPEASFRVTAVVTTPRYGMGVDHRAYPLVLGPGISDDPASAPGTVAVAWNGTSAWGPLPVWTVRYRDPAGVVRAEASAALVADHPVRVFVDYQAATRNLTLRLLDPWGEKARAVHAVGSQPGDGFAFATVGVATAPSPGSPADAPGTVHVDDLVLGAQAPAGFLAGPGLAFTDRGLPDATAFTYRVTAASEVGEGNLSALVNAITPTVPPAPALAVVRGPGRGEVTLTWTMPGNGGTAVTGFSVHRSADPGQAGAVLASLGNASGFTDTGLADGATWHYRVGARNAVGPGPLSAGAAGQAPTLPGAPAGLAAAPGPGPGQVTLSWATPSTGGIALAAVRVWRGDGAGPETLLAEAPPGGSFTDSGLPPGATHAYRVSLANAVGEGPLSALVQGQAPVLPGAPRNVTAAGQLNVTLWPAVNLDGIRVRWQAPATGHAPTAYRVYRGTSPGQESFLAQVPGTALSYQDNAVDPFTPYHYRVSALNPAGEGPPSAAACARTTLSLGLGGACAAG